MNRSGLAVAALIKFVSGLALAALVLGSLLSFAVFLGLIPLLVARIRNEEKVLSEGLEGYSEYMTKVRYRLLPYIW